ncbi:MAG: hypothetical protein QOJ03_2615 [Frankiaceae bacterium]|nr:hypothetical protein [Frankiaceae bacterium]
MARASAKKTQTRRPRKKATAARKTTVRKPAARPAASSGSSAAPAPGSIDLAGGLRQLLASVETEVREVSALSERIDKLVTDLNARRDDQTKRLLALDALRGSVDDTSLGAFLDKAIRPRKPRVAEVIPKRLQQF